jgi:stress response protein YsnF
MWNKRKKPPEDKVARRQKYTLSSDSDDSVKKYGQWMSKYYPLPPARKKRVRRNKNPSITPDTSKKEISGIKDPPSVQDTKNNKTSNFKTEETNVSTKKKDDEECIVVTPPVSSKSVSNSVPIKLDTSSKVGPSASTSSSSAIFGADNFPIKKHEKITFDLTNESEEKSLLPGARYETFFHMTHVDRLKQMRGIVVIANAPKTTVTT